MKEESKLYEWKDSDMDLGETKVHKKPKSKIIEDAVAASFFILFCALPSLVAIWAMLVVLFESSTELWLRGCIVLLLVGVYKFIKGILEAIK